MECPICYEEYGHAPHCPAAMEIEVDEYDREREQALKSLRRANKAWSRPVSTGGKSARKNGPKSKVSKPA